MTWGADQRPEPCQEYRKKQSAEENERRQSTFLQSEHTGKDTPPKDTERAKEGRRKEAEILRPMLNDAQTSASPSNSHVPVSHFHRR